MRKAWANAAALRSEKSVGCTMERMEEFIGMRPPRPSCELVHNFGQARSQQSSSGDAGATPSRNVLRVIDSNAVRTLREPHLEVRGDVVCLICVSGPRRRERLMPT